RVVGEGAREGAAHWNRREIDRREAELECINDRVDGSSETQGDGSGTGVGGREGNNEQRDREYSTNHGFGSELGRRNVALDKRCLGGWILARRKCGINRATQRRRAAEPCCLSPTLLRLPG